MFIIVPMPIDRQADDMTSGSGVLIGNHNLRLTATLSFVFGLIVASTAVADDSSPALARLFGKRERDADERLVLLDLPKQDLIDDDLRAVADLTSLKQLNLSFCKRVKNDGLQHLARLVELRELNVGGCKLIGDAGLEHLRSLTKLERLNLSVTQVSDDGLKTVALFSRLKGLDLDNTGVTEEGLPHLARLTDLEYLRLADLSITDRAVAQLIGFKKLKMLVLNGTELTDVGFQELMKLDRLERLSVSNTHVSSEAIEQAKRTRPTLRITGP